MSAFYDEENLEKSDQIQEQSQEEVFEVEEKKYRSSLGDFTFQQERILMFGKSWKTLIWLILEVSGYLASIVIFALFINMFKEDIFSNIR